MAGDMTGDGRASPSTLPNGHYPPPSNPKRRHSQLPAPRIDLSYSVSPCHHHANRSSLIDDGSSAQRRHVTSSSPCENLCSSPRLTTSGVSSAARARHNHTVRRGGGAAGGTVGWRDAMFVSYCDDGVMACSLGGTRTRRPSTTTRTRPTLVAASRGIRSATAPSGINSTRT